MKRKLIFTLFLLSSITLLQAQSIEVNFPKKDKETLDSLRKSNIDLTGIWEGTISQKRWKGMPRLKDEKTGIRFEMYQNGDKVTGKITCNTSFANDMGELSYEKNFEGEFNGKTFFYRDIQVNNYINTHKDLRRLEICLKTAALDFYVKDGRYFLEGDWTGNGHISGVKCAPGHIKFFKVSEKDKNVEMALVFEKDAEIFEEQKEIVLNRKKGVKKIKGRKVKEGQTIKVKNSYITIEVYDHKKDDGDIISLNCNGNWIIEELRIAHKSHTVDVYIDPDDAPNFLILYAHNLGAISPNTCAIIVDDGERKQQFVLNSNLKESDILYFEYIGD